MQGAVLVGEPPADEVANLRARVDADREKEQGLLSSLRSLRTPYRIGLVIAAVVLVTVASLVTTPRADIAAYPTGRMVLTLALLGMAAGAAAARLLRPVHAPPPNVWVSRALLVVGVLTPCLLALIPLHHDGAPAGAGSAFVANCGRCLGFGGALGLPVLLLALWARRTRVDGAAVAVLGGVTAGLAGNLALQVHCPITDPSHLLVGHVTLLALLGVVAAVWHR